MLRAQAQPSQPSLTSSTTPHPPSTTPPSPFASGALNHRTKNCPGHRRTRRHPLGLPRRGQARRARRAADPAVQARTASFMATRAAALSGTSTGSGKQTYNPGQLLSLRPQSHPPLRIAALCFVPHASRYSCYARAVRLGFADSLPSRACAFARRALVRDVRTTARLAPDRVLV